MTNEGSGADNNEDSEFRICLCLKGFGVPRKQRRINGFQYPLHPQQIIGWVTLIFTSLTTIFIVVPGLCQPLSSIQLYVIPSLYLFHMCFNITTTLLDPAEEDVRKKKTCEVVPEFDRKKHSHVIENGRCHLCNISCSGAKTKHCGVCNKCVSGFDHHCKWLNHCIGKRNYATFVLSVCSAILIAIVTIVVVVLEFVFYFTDPSQITFRDSVESHNKTVENVTHYSIIDDTPVTPKEVMFLSFATFLGVLAIVTAILLTHLCLFHIYISYLGLTTYEYVRNQQDKNGIMVSEDSQRGCCKKDNDFMEDKSNLHCSSLSKQIFILRSHKKNVGNSSGIELSSNKNDLAAITSLNNYQETNIESLKETPLFKEYSNGARNLETSKKKQRSSLCHNQVDPLPNHKLAPNSRPLRELILSPLPLKSISMPSKYTSPNVSNGKQSDEESIVSDNSNVNFSNKKVLSPILETNNEINNDHNC